MNILPPMNSWCRHRPPTCHSELSVGEPKILQGNGTFPIASDHPNTQQPFVGRKIAKLHTNTIDTWEKLFAEKAVQGGGEPADKTWHSGAKVAVKPHAGYYAVEVALPRKSMKDGLARPYRRPWGANFCRTAYKPARKKDKYTTWSPMLRGRFHQPDMFGHIYFVKVAK